MIFLAHNQRKATRLIFCLITIAAFSFSFLTSCGKKRGRAGFGSASAGPSSGKIWYHPADIDDNISPNGQSAAQSSVAVDSSGNAIVVWIQSDGVNTQVFKSEYRSGSWTHPANVTDNISPDGQPATRPQVAMDDDGNAIIVWSQNDGTRSQIFKSEYRSGSWTHPANLADNISPDTSADYPRLAMDNNGNAVIAWIESDGATDQTFKSEYRTGAWTHPANATDNISPDGQNSSDPALAMDDNGNAIIVWRQSDGTRNQTFKSEYRTGVWTHPASLADNVSQDTATSAPHVAMDNNDNAIIVWGQTNGTNTQTFKSEYRSGSWTHPAGVNDNISPDGGDVSAVRAAMDSNGNAIVVWSQWDGTSEHIYRSEYRSGAWTHPANFADKTNFSGFAYEPQPAMDDNGNALIVWYEYDGTTNFKTFKSEYRSGAWTHPSSIADDISPDASSVASTSVAMGNNGDAVISWNQDDSTAFGQIFVSHYR